MKNKAKGDVYWYLPKKKKPIAYSTTSTKLIVGILSHEDKTRTIKDVQQLIKYDKEAINILQIYIDNGYGDELAFKYFG